MSKRILFITTLNLATNPRLVKEIDLAVNSGFEVEVMSFIFPKSHWSSAYNMTIMEKYPSVRFINIPAGREKIISWLLSVFVERFFRFVSVFLELNEKCLSFAVTRRSYLIHKNLYKASKADLVIGHNPGTLYPAWFAAHRMKASCGFDVEDYHPGEGSDLLLKKITLILQNQCFPKYDYLTFSSKSIMYECLKNIVIENDKGYLIINNYFPVEEFIEPKDIQDDKIQLVWFSQKIGHGRGLEDIIKCISKHSDKFSLTLYGSCEEKFEREYIEGSSFIQLKGVLSQKELHKVLSTYDVGLAIEDSTVDQNRDLCLTNKIISYYQSGLFILASNTKEQHEFIVENCEVGTVYTDNTDLEEKLISLFINRVNIRKSKYKRYLTSRRYSWESESNKLLKKWNHL